MKKLTTGEIYHLLNLLEADARKESQVGRHHHGPQQRAYYRRRDKLIQILNEELTSLDRCEHGRT